MRQYNVLVSSIGGDVGQAVCKALRYSGYNIKILGTDCRNYVPYSIFCDSFHIIPKADGSAYEDSMNKLISDNSIELVYICSELELFYICDHFNELALNFYSRTVIPSLSVINTCRDKYKTMEFLKTSGFPYANSVIYKDSTLLEKIVEGLGYPLVLKKISDCGSKNFHIIKSIKDFNDINDLDSTYMLQEYIPGTEYTNAVYRDKISSEIYVISLERNLKNGISDEVKVVFDKEIEELCKEIANKLDLSGSINIQLRKQEGRKPVIFEINPRYSSTSFMRARFGFNDVIYAFENIILKRNINAPQIKTGEAYRYLTEYYKFY